MKNNIIMDYIYITLITCQMDESQEKDRESCVSIDR
jgi:hypothetical protein